MMYDPSDWYWVVGYDYRRFWSSARRAYVPASDPVYVEWVEAGNNATAILTEDELGDVLDAAYPAGSPRGPRKITPLEFQARFTETEWGTICAGALASPTILSFALQLVASSEIDLLDAKTSAGLDALVSAGLLTADRPAQILSTSISS